MKYAKTWQGCVQPRFTAFGEHAVVIGIGKAELAMNISLSTVHSRLARE